MPTYPIADLHCDLLSYMGAHPHHSAYNSEQIGCSIPRLREGNVQAQVMAIFTVTAPGSVEKAVRQAEIYAKLANLHSLDFQYIGHDVAPRDGAVQSPVRIVSAIENASGICEEGEPLSLAFQRLEHVLGLTGNPLYMSLTHHDENRFGGGNYSEAGLKPDGLELLRWMDGRRIAIDLSHTSDALAYGILDAVDRLSLKVPVIASHSNFREIWEHRRNLPRELAQEVVRRGGIIGINFVRAFVDNQLPNRLLDHIEYGVDQLNAPEQICFGADLFATNALNDPSRIPYFHPEHANSGCYPAILNQLAERGWSTHLLKQLAFGNFQKYWERTFEGSGKSGN